MTFPAHFGTAWQQEVVLASERQLRNTETPSAVETVSSSPSPHYGHAGQNTPRCETVSNHLELAWVMPSSTLLILQGILLILQAFYNGIFGFLHPEGSGLCLKPHTEPQPAQCCSSHLTVLLVLHAPGDGSGWMGTLKCRTDFLINSWGQIQRSSQPNAINGARTGRN